MEKYQVKRKELRSYLNKHIYKCYDDECILVFDREKFESKNIDVEICIESYSAGQFTGVVYFNDVAVESKRLYSGREFEEEYGFVFYNIAN